MIKKPWLIALSLVLLLAATIFVVSGCNLVQTTTTTTTSRVKCNGQQTNLGSGTPLSNETCFKRFLVFSKTGGFRHASIKDGEKALQKLAAEHNYTVDITEDASVFTDANLARYDAVVFLLTTGNILNDNQKAAFERYIRAGGGYVGVHSASDTEYAWLWYGGLVGAYFDRIHGHSKVVEATIHVIDRTHPSTMMLPAVWIRTDEWYNFATNPRGRVNVLMTVDERTYKGGTMGVDHPIAWYHEYDGGRAWYTALGHTSESYSEPLFLDHLWGGIIYASSGRQRAIAIYQVKETQVIEVLIVDMLLFAVSRSLWLSILALVLFGISQNWVGATVITLAQLRVPPQMPGRVMSLNTLLIMGVRPLGDFPAGALIALIGGPYTVIISASIVGSYSLYLLIGRPVIRTLQQ